METGHPRVARLFDKLENWIGARNPKDTFRIISGGPGIGKSSSMRAFAASVARSRIAYPIVVPLQKLERPDQALRTRVSGYLTDHRLIPFTKSPLDGDLSAQDRGPILLIFDGLDELVRPGKDADDIAREFMVDLRGLLDAENSPKASSPAQLMAIVTGRVAAAESAARTLKSTGDQVLHLLPFALHNEETQKYHDPKNLLDEDQRVTWWARWHSVAPDVPNEIPPIFLRSDLFDVTAEPLLLYFIAFVRPWEEMSSGALFRGALYNRLLQDFYTRECDKGGRNFATEFQTFEEYQTVLQATALAAWYDGSTRTGTIDLVFKLLYEWNPEMPKHSTTSLGLISLR